MEKLTETGIRQHLEQIDGWKRADQKWIVKRFHFKTFMDGMAFVNQIADFSEQVNHHPFITIDYKAVTLKLSSWHAGGLTDLDFELAGKYNQFAEKIKNQTPS